MKISIITVVRNDREFIEDCIKSVLVQTYGDVEHIIIDGGSTDGTLDILNRYKDKVSRLISEKDTGIYEALNKGIAVSRGEVVGFLHSDDVYDNGGVIEKIADVFHESGVQGVYGDLVYVKRRNVDKIIRYWRAGKYTEGLLSKGWSLPHPTFFVKKDVYDKFGNYDTSLKIAADYEITLRFLRKHKITVQYLPEVLVRMRVGGVSNTGFKNIVRKTFEDFTAWKINGLEPSIRTIVKKNLFKLPQFFLRKDSRFS